MPFEYIIRVQHTSPNAGLALTEELEKRFHEYFDDNTVQLDDPVTKQIITSGWSKVQSPEEFINVRVLKKPQLSRSKVPAVEFVMYVDAPPVMCAQFFQNVNEQKQPRISPKLEEATNIIRLVKNQQPFQDPSLKQPIAMNLTGNWFAAYKNVSFLYTRHKSMAPSLGIPPIDAVNVTAVRKFPEGKKGSWLIMSMSAHCDDYKAREEYTRAENYISFTIIEPYESEDGSIITKLRVVECLSIDGHAAKDIINVHIQNEVERFGASVERIAQIQEENASTSAAE